VLLLAEPFLDVADAIFAVSTATAPLSSFAPHLTHSREDALPPPRGIGVGRPFSLLPQNYSSYDPTTEFPFFSFSAREAHSFLPLSPVTIRRRVTTLANSPLFSAGSRVHGTADPFVNIRIFSSPFPSRNNEGRSFSPLLFLTEVKT